MAVDQQKLYGGYQLIEQLGSGGMGEVWRAHHELLNRNAAVKLIRVDSEDDGPEPPLRLLRRFEREAQATAGLESPHTVRVYDFGISDGTFFYAMELLNGLDLQSFVDRFGPMPADRAVFLLRQVCESLEEAHHNGLIHRDIKPANIFVGKVGLKYDVAKVLDFGLVKAIDGALESTELTNEGSVPGSPAYMAPEVARGGYELDGRVDIYGLACVAYWMVSGELVFEGDTAIQVVLAHLEQEPTAPSQRTELPIPEALDRLILDCLKKDREARPVSASEVLERLDECTFDQPWSHTRAKRWWELHHPNEESPEPGKRTSKPKKSPKIERVGDLTLSDHRNRTLHVIQDHFAHNRINMVELDRRTELAAHAESPAQLEAIIEDLPALRATEEQVVAPPIVDTPEPIQPEQALVAPAPTALAPQGRESQRLIGFFSGPTRRGVWRPAREIKATAVFGGVDLDFREAQLQPGVTEVKCKALFGGISIIVLPDMYVEVEGTGVMGGFDYHRRGHPLPDKTDAPWIRVTGLSVMGGVDVKVPKKRRKLLRKLLGRDKEKD